MSKPPGIGCQLLWPMRSSCGPHGSCEIVNNISICVCEKDYEQSIEFSGVYVYPEDILCDTNEKSVQLLYHMCFALAVITILHTIFLLESKSQVVKSIPALLGFCFICACAGYRVHNPKAFFAEDVIFSFLIATSYGFSTLANYVFYVSYFNYMFKSISWKETMKQHVAIFIKIQKLLLIPFILTHYSWVVACFYDRVTAAKIVRVSFGVTGFRFLYDFLNAHFLLKQFISDLQKMVTLRPELSDHAETQMRNRWVRRQIPKAKRMRMSLLFTNIVFAVWLLLPAFWEFWYTGWKFALVALVLVYLFNSNLILRNRAKKRNYDFNDRNNSTFMNGVILERAMRGGSFGRSMNLVSSRKLSQPQGLN